jgi:methylenetetrahydrofolate dehydrogenase (NADP+)/methenyltetrahydrofolate cyclohydrolase
MRYIRQKEKWAKYLGINFELYKFPIDISGEQLKQEIQNLNQNQKISGYIVQFPLPKTIDLHSIIGEISPLKDVDGFHPENQGKTLIGDTSGLTACTPAGVMKLLSAENIDVAGKHVVVL